MCRGAVCLLFMNTCIFIHTNTHIHVISENVRSLRRLFGARTFLGWNALVQSLCVCMCSYTTNTHIWIYRSLECAHKYTSPNGNGGIYERSKAVCAIYMLTFYVYGAATSSLVCVVYVRINLKRGWRSGCCLCVRLSIINNKNVTETHRRGGRQQTATIAVCLCVPENDIHIQMRTWIHFAMKHAWRQINKIRCSFSCTISESN